MKIRFGIMMKLSVWYFVIMTISYGTILFFYIYMQQIMKVSDDIVNRKYKISAHAKKMIDSLLNMEENEKKYDVLKKMQYIEYFVAAQKEYEGNLLALMQLESGTDGCAFWEELYRNYQVQLPGDLANAEIDYSQSEEAMQVPWIPEEVINYWIRRISAARAENERGVEAAMVDIHNHGQKAVHWGLIGLGLAGSIGLVGVLFLTYSMSRPLRELRKGIRSFSREGPTEPIRILARDEFGELALTFNEMTARLREEEHMRSDFVSMLSHEIRTPLTSIRESVNLIAEEVMGPINERQRRFLEIASLELDRISNILNHLMQVSRMEVGALHIHPCPMDPSILAMNSVYRLAPAAEARRIKVDALVPGDLPMVMGDRENLQQVLLNLLGNAIKFTPPEGEVVVRVEPDDAVDFVRFTVSDSGPGIPDEERAMIFHKYYRASGIRDQVDGVGLGLSISKYIVEAHGGSIWVENREGGGSAFGFTVPVAPKEQALPDE